VRVRVRVRVRARIRAGVGEPGERDLRSELLISCLSGLGLG
jgi:hypothetical protein